MSNPLNEYLMRPMDDGSIRIYYPYIRKGRKAYKIIGNFTIKGKSIDSIAEEITRKSEEIVKKYLAEMN